MCKGNVTFEDRVEEFSKDIESAKTDKEQMCAVRKFIVKASLGDDPSQFRCEVVRAIVVAISIAVIAGLAIINARTGYPVLALLGVYFVFSRFGPMKQDIMEESPFIKKTLNRRIAELERKSDNEKITEEEYLELRQTVLNFPNMVYTVGIFVFRVSLFVLTVFIAGKIMGWF